jgi:hypothetical protein
MVTETNSELASENKAFSTLHKLFGTDVQSVSPRAWKIDDAESAIWVVYLPDAGPQRREEDEPPEPALELIRPLEDLGYAGSVCPEDAARHLRAMAEADHLRLTRRAHPDASGRITLAAVATLYLQDLDLAELRATAEAIRAIALVERNGGS